MKNSTTDLLVDNCDEFIYYEDLVRERSEGTRLERPSTTRRRPRSSSCSSTSIQALLRENKEVLWASMVKETMKRKKPSFNEEYYGYRRSRSSSRTRSSTRW